MKETEANVNGPTRLMSCYTYMRTGYYVHLLLLMPLTIVLAVKKISLSKSYLLNLSDNCPLVLQDHRHGIIGVYVCYVCLQSKSTVEGSSLCIFNDCRSSHCCKVCLNTLHHMVSMIHSD